MPWCWTGDNSLHEPMVTEFNKSMLGRVTPLGRPRSVCKGNVESLGILVICPWKSKSNFQATFPKILVWKWLNGLIYQGQWPLFSIPVESIIGCMFGANLVIPVEISDEFMGQDRTDGQTQVTTIPLRPEIPRGNTAYVTGLQRVKNKQGRNWLRERMINYWASSHNLDISV